MSHLQKIACPHCAISFFHDGSIAGTTIKCPFCEERVEIPRNAEMHDDPPREIQDEALKLNCRMAGQHPVQATGSVQGYPFYFRAKWNHWTFKLSLEIDYDPASLEPPTSYNGLFYEGEVEGYFMSDDFPEASYMRYDEAEAIIRKCARSFLDAMESAG